MPDYRYVAIDPQGRERKGRLTAANDDAARADLARRKFHVVTVEAAGARPASRSLLAFRRNKLSSKELALFTRQLATLAEVAPLEEALRTLTRQSEAESARAVIGDVHAGLLEGRRLADAMARQPGSFPPLYRAMVAAGETTGSLTTILARLADLLERQAEAAKAAPLSARALALRTERLGRTHALAVESLLLEARIETVLGRPQRGEALAREALSAIEKERPGAWRERGEAMSVLGATLRAQGREAEAEPLLREAIRILQPLGEGAPSLREAEQRLSWMRAG